MKTKYPHIFEPMTIRRMTVKNRIVMTPMGTNYGEQNGEVSIPHRVLTEQHSFVSTLTTTSQDFSNYARAFTNMVRASRSS